MAKERKTKIPKRIAGVKLPKELRRVGNAVLDEANSPEGRELVAAGLTMAAAAATAALAKGRAAEKAAEPKPETPGQGGTHDPAAFADALGGMAEAALGKLFGARKV